MAIYETGSTANFSLGGLYIASRSGDLRESSLLGSGCGGLRVVQEPARIIGGAEVVDVWSVWRSGLPAAYGLPMMLREVPDHIRLDNGPESTARVVREWVDRVGARTLYIEPRSPWENGYIESFSGKLRDELLDREIFYTLLEVRVLTER